MKSKKVFIVYSKNDASYKKQLLNHFSTLRAKGIIEEWNSEQIIPGTEWDKKIKNELRVSDIILLLISSDFLSSKYIIETELKLALELHSKSISIVIPVILRACDWEESEFSNLQALPTEGKPVNNWKDSDEAYLNIVKGIKKVLISLDAKEEYLKPQINESKEPFFTLVRDSVLVKLPRSFVIVTNLEYNESNFWSVKVNNYNYSGGFKGSIKITPEFLGVWYGIGGKKQQLDKLKILPFDEMFFEPVIHLAVAIRNRNSEEEISQIISIYRDDFSEIEFYDAGTQIDRLSVPENLKEFNVKGQVYDILTNLNFDYNLEFEDLAIIHKRLESNRRKAVIYFFEHLEPNHPASNFISQIAEEYNSKFDKNDLKIWTEKLSDSINQAIECVDWHMSNEK